MLDHMSRLLAYDASFDAEGIILRYAVVDLQPNEQLVTNLVGVLMEPSLFLPRKDSRIASLKHGNRAASVSSLTSLA
jgi:hypothetical protein